MWLILYIVRGVGIISSHFKLPVTTFLQVDLVRLNEKKILNI